MSKLVKRTYGVVRKVAESETITSFYLRPTDGKPLASFKPGQFLILDMKIPGRDKSVIRNYSVSNWPLSDNGELRLTIKKEPAPPASIDIEAGLVSTFMHEQMDVGYQIDAAGPSGQFYLKENSDKPVVLLSGGVGITPMASMAHALAGNEDRETYFIHACDSSSVHAFSSEISEIAKKYNHVKQHICYRFPLGTEVLGVDYHSAGFLTKDVLKSILPLDVYEFYLCGPPPFMQAIYSCLLALGVSESSINYEFFGPASLLKTADNTGNVAPITKKEDKNIAKEGSDGPRITFAKSNVEAFWNEGYDNLLEFAEANGVEPNFSCRIGICNECKCNITAGEVKYITEPLDPPESGKILPCCAKPTTDIFIDI